MPSLEQSKVKYLIDQIRASNPLNPNQYTFTPGETLMIASRAKGDVLLPRPRIFILGCLDEIIKGQHAYTYHSSKTALFISLRNPIRILYDFPNESYPTKVLPGLEPGQKGITIMPKTLRSPVWRPNTYSVTPDQYQELLQIFKSVR